MPESVRGRRAWRQTARLVEDYRQYYQISDTDRPLGDQPRDHHDPERQQAWRQASSAVERMQARQQPDRDRQRSQPESVRTLTNRGGESTSRHAATRDLDPVQGPERAAG